MKKMKKIIYKAIVLIATTTIVSSALTSCENAREIEQQSELTETTAFSSIEHLQSGLNGAYAAYGPDFGGNGTGDAIFFNAIFTDNVKSGIDSNGQGSNEYNLLLQPGTDFPGRIWSNRYLVINRINRVIRAINGVTIETPAEQIEVNHIHGQLIALRALAHFDLFQYFTTDYTDTNALSVINMDFVPDLSQELELPRNTVSETLSFIKNDLDIADDLLDPSNATAATRIYINNDFIKALRTRIAITEGDNSTALTLSTELVTAYPLADQTQYTNMFADTANGEVIFKLTRGQTDNGVADLFYFNAVAANGGAYLEVSNQLYNEFETNDIRFDTNINSESVIAGVNSPDNLILINKYPGSTAGPLTNDIKIFRSSEMLLIKAEAQARNMALGDAATSIRDLRTARYGVAQSTPTYNNLNEALTDILYERRKELCFEGHRYLDLKRLGGELNVGINRLDADCSSFSAPCNLLANDFKFTLPIPTSELNGNSVITQNPNY